MPHMDVFRQNASGAFEMMSLTSTLLDQPHVPMRLSALGLFVPDGVRTTDVSIERQGNTLQLVQSAPRGAPYAQNVKDDRSLIKIPTVRLGLEDHISADEVQNIRGLGSETDLMALTDEVNRRNLRMSNSIEATIEYHRIGAIKGQVLDANGDVLHDLFTLFGVVAQPEVDFDLDNASPASGALRKKCSGVIRSIEDELGGLQYTTIYAQCSSQFYDDLTAHPEYRANKLNTETGAPQLNERIARRSVDFAGITFEEYRGQVGNVKYVADDKAHIFPLGVPDNFITRYAPAPYWGTVNTPGLPRYARMRFNDDEDRVTTRVETYLLNLCTRPRTLIPARRT